MEFLAKMSIIAHYQDWFWHSSFWFITEIPEEDPFYMQHGQRCMHFVRSMPAPQLGCTFGFGEQQNQITGFHDGSNVYGSDDEEFEKLRENKVSTVCLIIL